MKNSHLYSRIEKTRDSRNFWKILKYPLDGKKISAWIEVVTTYFHNSGEYIMQNLQLGNHTGVLRTISHLYFLNASST